MTVKLLIVDDHEVIRTGLHAMFSGTDFEIAAEAISAAEALAEV
jgi:YesN/AraC family two-component response regulator